MYAAPLLTAVWRDRRGGTAAGGSGAWPAARRPSSGVVLQLRLRLHAGEASRLPAGEPRGGRSSDGARGARRRATAAAALAAGAERGEGEGQVGRLGSWAGPPAGQ